MIEGIIAHTRTNDSWEVQLAPDPDALAAQLIESQPPDGVIAVYRLIDRALLGRVGVPAVLVLHHEPDAEFSIVTDDEDAVASVAVDYFRDRGLRRLAFLDHEAPPSLRRERFVAAAEQAGLSCDAYPPVGQLLQGGWNHRTQQIGNWAQTLRPPVGVLCFRVQQAQQLATACRRRGIDVPDAIAILATNGDDVECHLVTPALSAIDLGGDRLGWEAAEQLARRIAGDRSPPRMTRFAPAGITRRPSTDIQASEDPHVARATKLIREGVTHGITVREVVAAVGVSRRRLDYGLQSITGRTLHQQIQHERLQRAKQLLARTHLPLTEVSLRCGFAYPSRMSEAFRRELQQTPSEFRDHNRIDRVGT
jgi:LacI family transcriptional regulator